MAKTENRTTVITVASFNTYVASQDSGVWGSEEIVREYLNSSPTLEPTTPVPPKPHRSVTFWDQRVRPLSPNRTISSQGSRPSSQIVRSHSHNSLLNNRVGSASSRLSNSLQVSSNGYAFVGETECPNNTNNNSSLTPLKENDPLINNSNVSHNSSKPILRNHERKLEDEIWGFSDIASDDPFPDYERHEKRKTTSRAPILQTPMKSPSSGQMLWSAVILLPLSFFFLWRFYSPLLCLAQCLLDNGIMYNAIFM